MFTSSTHSFTMVTAIQKFDSMSTKNVKSSIKLLKNDIRIFYSFFYLSTTHRLISCMKNWN